ncbi:hypothetical protein L9W92_16805 [Pelotomaculum terephthalicicum JT]|uniref:hypothetical protein n=1 Tax=Pelotomaculum TaxID=191373 RepID=UPI0009C8BACD|nr:MULTISPECIES: hypothetical protein [Pelotomaculum]MCG9969665.1 hypothetical protein [Pelotomaculum terephthalicicum JT]OPX92187.1 MAG: hypothetical protein A4E54_00074 [Pelotomaculum sp. PtaB.Bin117]OPY62434.1 MAG: hypothetical protein A4E56_01349 [Pelotomaculum sp. PtaU1.Bin065]
MSAVSGKIENKKEKGEPLVTVRVVCSEGGGGLKDAYRLLAGKVRRELEARNRCTRQSMSG